MLALHRLAFWNSRKSLNIFALFLVLSCSGVLLYLMKDGIPSRAAMAGIITFVCLVPVLIRWQLGWMTLFFVIPWLAWLRRFEIFLLNEKVFKNEAMDVTLLVPDIITAAMISGFLLTRYLRKPVALVEGEWAFVTCLKLFIGLCVLEVFNPIMGSIAGGVNGLRVFVLMFGLYWVTAEVVKTKDIAIRWVVLTACSGAIVGAYGAYQYLVGFPSYDVIWALGTGTDKQVIGDAMRAFSTFSFTSTFSHYMIIAVLCGWALFVLDDVGRLTRLFGPLVVSLALLGISVTFVRSSFLGMVAACVVGLVVAGPAAKKRVWRLVAVAVVAIGVLIASPSAAGDNAANESTMSTSGLVAERVLSMKDPNKVGSFSVRIDTWVRLTELCFSTYQAGVGLGAGAADRFGGDGFAKAVAYTESQYFSMLAEMGWVGFFLFIYLTSYGMLYTIRIYDALEDPDRRRLALLSLMLQVGILITGVTGGTVLYTLPGSAYYWTALGLATALARMERAEKEKAALLSATVA